MIKPRNLLTAFVADYVSRHKNNINKVLHIIGIPLAIFGIVQLFRHNWESGLIGLFLGYLLQWFGHTCFEKNELGELLIIKAVIHKLLKE